MEGSQRKGLGLAPKIALTMLVLGLIGLVAGPATFSAFSGSTSNSGNSFTAGTVTLGDSDGGASMFVNLSALKGGDSFTRCIRVTYTGSLDSTVRLYGATTGSLGQYLDLKITRGTGTDNFPDCTNFTPDGTEYIAGQGQGVIYNGTLGSYPTTYSAGVVDPLSATPETWTANEAHVYRLQITVQDNNAAQGLSATQAFTWEARNL